MSFRIRGLDPRPFAPLWSVTDRELAAMAARRVRADRSPGFPDRVTLRDALPGEWLLLVNYEHQPAATPFRARHAIYLLEGAQQAFDAIDDVPPALRLRPLSLRAFDATHELVAADLAEGAGIEPAVEQLLHDPAVAYVHAHYAKPGCYAARIDRV
ncbi:MAG: DUF1203 domain-containing protein [Proteobacteria bacterium]|nr:DUF1203 domain-containing protein [Pseudomonadota bacterium]